MQTALARIIGAIGSADFTAVTAHALSRALDFELAAIILHAGTAPPETLHDDLTRVGCSEGMRNYLGTTHRMNPMLRAARTEAVRASDYATRPAAKLACAQDCLIWTDDEELGFRTRGWPERQEEIGLYMPAPGGIVELSLYRDRRRTPAPGAHLAALSAIGTPLAAAFSRHAALSGAAAEGRLSKREREIHDLIVRGCSSEAIALRLGISRHTVKDHRKHIFRKLGVGSLAELIARHWARAHPPSEGLSPPDTTEH